MNNLIKYTFIINLSIILNYWKSPHELSSEWVRNLIPTLYESYLKTYNFVIVEYYAPWCPHCQNMLKSIDHLGYVLNHDHSDTLMLKVNCVKYNDFCREQDINHYPTLLLLSKYKGNYYNDIEFAIKEELKISRLSVIEMLEKLSADYLIKFDRHRYEEYTPKLEKIEQKNSLIPLNFRNIKEDIILTYYKIMVNYLEKFAKNKENPELATLANFMYKYYPRTVCKLDFKNIINLLLHDKFKYNKSYTFKAKDYYDEIMESVSNIQICKKEYKSNEIDNYEYSYCNINNGRKNGYTCGIWLFIHTVLINTKDIEYSIENCNFHPLKTIVNFIIKNFECVECTENFKNEVRKIFNDNYSELDSSKINANQSLNYNSKIVSFDINNLCLLSRKNSSIYMWKLHNSVNTRLRLEDEQTQGEYAINLHYNVPTSEQCADCKNGDVWDENKVWFWLVRTYTNYDSEDM